MGFPVNAIGRFSFLSLEGAWSPPGEEIAIESREGVDGNLFWKTGRHGQPFELESRVDIETIGLAQYRFTEYRTLIGAGAQRLFQANGDMRRAATPYDVMVIDVRLVSAIRLANATYGLNPPSRGFLVCRWVLCPVEVEVEE